MPGKLFEEFIVGDVFRHQPGRTVTEADNVLFSCITMVTGSSAGGRNAVCQLRT